MGKGEIEENKRKGEKGGREGIRNRIRIKKRKRVFGEE